MTPDIPPKKDLEFQGIRNRMQVLSNIPELLIVEETWPNGEMGQLRDALKSADVELDLDEAARESLRQSQFRDLDTGRGPGMVTALKGKEKAEKLLSWCETTAREVGWDQKFPSTGVGLGLQQAAADLVTVAVFGEPNEEVIAGPDAVTAQRAITRINQRVWRGYERTYKGTPQAGVVESKFARIGKPDRPLRMAGLPPETLIKLYDFLVKRTS